jgi:hypothetical protein
MASGLTPTYLLPYPLSTDPVNVHGDVEDLADRLETLLVIFPRKDQSNTFVQPNIFDVNSTSTAVRITQTGTGNAFLVEDSANPDTSPFIIDNSGNVGIGKLSPSAKLDVFGSTFLTTSSSSAIPLIVQGATSQTSNLQEWQNSTSTVLARVSSTGEMFSVTAPADTNTVQVATTAFVLGQASSSNPSALGASAIGTSTRYARADHVHPTTGLGLTSGTLAQFAATTSSQLAGVISDETGTGSLVFANGPTINNLNLTGQVTGLELSFGQSIIFEGTTADANELTLTAGDPTQDRTITLPDASGTVALVNDKLSVFASTTSSELAGVISDETGTGSLVFGTAPTLNGLITINTPDASTSGLLVRGVASQSSNLQEWQNSSNTVVASVGPTGIISSATWQGNVIGPIYGGTGQSSYTTGDILFASASNTLSKLGIGTSGHLLTVGAGGVPSWAPAPISLPDQTGNAGKYLTTNGTVASWVDIQASAAFAQDTEPVSPVEGTIWLDTNGEISPASVELVRWTRTATEGQTVFSGVLDGPTTTTTNLVPNPSFETDTTGWVASDGTLTRITTDSVFGSACGRFDATANAGVSILSSVTASQTYTISAYVKGEVGKTFRLRIEERTASDSVGFINSSTITANGTWQRLTVRRNFGATGVVAGLHVQNMFAGAHTILIDGAMLTQGETTETYFDGNTTATNNATFAWTGTVNNSSSTRQSTNLVPARTNLMPNPSFELNSLGWTAARMTVALDSTTKFVGEQALRGTVSATTAEQYFDHSTRIPVTVGRTYTASVYVFLPVANTGSTTIRAALFPHTGSAFLAGITGTPVVATNGQWTRISVTGTMPATTTSVMLRVAFPNIAALNDVMIIDGVLIEEGTTVGDYFDGNFNTSGNFDYRWSGIIGASSSEQLLPASSLLSYEAASEQVFLNGVQLIRGIDYTASDGVSISLASPAALGDVMQVITLPEVALGTVDVILPTSITPPPGAEVGQMWYNSANGKTYVYYDNFWVEVAGTATNVTPNPTSPNYIINGAFDIWQRGTSFTQADGFAADRWRLRSNVAVPTALSMSRQTFTPAELNALGFGDARFFVRQTVTTHGSGTVVGFEHRLEDVTTLAGQTVTVSFWAKAETSRNLDVFLQQNFGSGGSSTVTTTIQQVAATTSWQRFTRTFTLSSISGLTIGTNSFLSLSIRNATSTNGHVLDLWGVQLEAGSVATPFRRNANSIQGELAACQRYYYRIQPGVVNAIVSLGFANSTTATRMQTRFPVTMRVNPTAIDFAGLYLSDGVNAFTTLSSIANASTNNSGVVTINVASGLTQFRPYDLNTLNATDFIGFSAEL